MELVGYAALGGLERVAIVAGAVLIGYWGYRLYVGEKNAGLVFMALAVIVLVGALATGSSHVKSIGEGYQLASVPKTLPAALETPVPAPVPAADPEPVAVTDAQPEEPSPFKEKVPEPMTEVAVEEPAEVEPAAPMPTETMEPASTEADSPARLATGQELGGRIVSVKSENVSLEWSSDSD
jgi:hypothetical protein